MYPSLLRSFSVLGLSNPSRDVLLLGVGLRKLVFLACSMLCHVIVETRRPIQPGAEGLV